MPLAPALDIILDAMNKIRPVMEITSAIFAFSVLAFTIGLTIYCFIMGKDYE